MTSTRLSPEERKNSPFRRVFQWELKHNRLFAGFFAGGMVGGVPIALLIAIINNEDVYTLTNWSGYTAEEVRAMFASAVMTSFDSILATAAVLLITGFVLCMGVNTFGYLHNRRSVDLYHAFPIRRTPMLMAEFLAVLISLLIPEAVAMALSTGILQCYGLLGYIGVFTLLRGLGLLLLLTTACLAFTMFLMVVSGTLLNAALALVSLAAGWPLAVTAVNLTMSLFLPGYVTVIPSAAYTLLCPFDALIQVFPSVYFTWLVENDAQSAYYNASLWQVLWWVIFTLVLVLASVLYFRRRKGEYAENNFSFPGVRGLIRMILAVAVGLYLGDTLGNALDSNPLYFVGVALGAVATHIIFQLVMTRGVRGLLRTIPAGVVTLALLGGFLYVLYDGGLGYVTRVPAAEDVASVSFSLPGYYGDSSKESYLADYASIDVYDEDYYGITVSPVFTDTEDIQTIVDLHQSVLTKFPGPYLPFSQLGSNAGVEVDYTLKDGRTLTRYYLLRLYADDENLLSAIAAVQKRDALQKYALYYYEDSSSVSSVSVSEYTNSYSYDAANEKLTEEEQQQIWETFTEELESASFSVSNTLLTEEEYKAAMEDTDEDSSDSSADYSGGSTDYTITMAEMPITGLSEELQQIVQQRAEENGLTNASTVGSFSYLVPECCTRTRALIDQLTEADGEYYYYEDEGDEDVAVADETAADETAIGGADGPTSIYTTSAAAKD